MNTVALSIEGKERLKMRSVLSQGKAVAAYQGVSWVVSPWPPSKLYHLSPSGSQKFSEFKVTWINHEVTQ